MTKAIHYYRVNTGKFEGIYELEELKTVIPTKRGVKCPCCAKEARPFTDIIQWGFWEDEYTTIFLCKSCRKALRYAYLIVCDAKVNAAALGLNEADERSEAV